MDDATRAPVSGTCRRCGCPLGYHSTRRDETWYCCGSCAGSDRCACGCKPEYARPEPTDLYVPTRRMFAARHPAGLRQGEDEDRERAFPFADPLRGR